MKKITIFDTSICSSNLGDFIIMESVKYHLEKMFMKGMFFYSYTHEKVGKQTYWLNKNTDLSFLGGTNLLSSNMNSYNQWKINLITTLRLKDIILFGVGWWQYQKKPNIYTFVLLKSVLNKNVLHSVRDSYTEEKLKSIGIKNVINTGCPSLWRLTEGHCSQIPKEKADSVVFTLTDYNKSPKNDFNLAMMLCKKYRNVYFWPQGIADLSYFNSFSIEKKIEVTPPSLRGFDQLLGDMNKSLDYVGTRLHAGVRAIQKCRRSIIIGIDNRAIEKSKDFNLMIVPRDGQNLLEKTIDSKFQTQINLPIEKIQRWKNQFK